MSTMENVVKSGYLDCYVRGVGNQSFQWQKRFYVLYGGSSNNRGRLDYYDNEEAYLTEPKVRKTIYLEEVRQAERDQDKNRQHVFQLVMCRPVARTYRFAAHSEQELSEWLKAILIAQKDNQSLQPPAVDEPSRVLVDQNAIYESAEDFQQYTVEVQETEAAKRCHLKISTHYELFVLSECLCLAEKDKRILSWNYKHIRRYGCGENNFTFEAGRKSLSGEGLFSFLVTRGEQLFRNVQDRMKHMQSKKNPEQDEFNKLLMSGSDSPTIPTRHYLSEDTSPGIMEQSNGPPLPPTRRSSGGSENGGIGALPAKPKVPPKVPMLVKSKSQDKKSSTSSQSEVEKTTPKALSNTSFQSELNSKLAKKPPPMLKPRNQNNPPVGERSASLSSPVKPSVPKSPNRISTGQNYELAKSNLPASELRKPLPHYCETSEQRELDPNYSENKLNAQRAKNEPEYMVYDICRSSSRRQEDQNASPPGEPYYDEMGTYCEASLPKNGNAWKECGVSGEEDDRPPPIYDTPADADTPAESPKMSAILAKLNQMKTQAHDTEYDHIGPQLVGSPLPAQGYYDHVVTHK